MVSRVRVRGRQAGVGVRDEEERCINCQAAVWQDLMQGGKKGILVMVVVSKTPKNWSECLGASRKLPAPSVDNLVRGARRQADVCNH